MSERRQVYEAAREVLDHPASAEPDDPRYQSKQVFEWFGRATLLAQSLEFELATLLTAADAYTKEEFTLKDIERLRRINLKATMGELRQLVRRLNPPLVQDDDLLDALDEALDVRNHLAHHFFIEHIRDIDSFTGRFAMLRELLETIEMFQSVFERLKPIIQRVRSVDEDHRQPS